MTLVERYHRAKVQRFFSYILTIVVSIGISIIFIPLIFGFIMRDSLNHPKINLSGVEANLLIQKNELTTPTIVQGSTAQFFLSFQYMKDINKEQQKLVFNRITNATGVTISVNGYDQWQTEFYLRSLLIQEEVVISQFPVKFLYKFNFLLTPTPATLAFLNTIPPGAYLYSFYALNTIYNVDCEILLPFTILPVLSVSPS